MRATTPNSVSSAPRAPSQDGDAHDVQNGVDEQIKSGVHHGVKQVDHPHFVANQTKNQNEDAEKNECLHTDGLFLTCSRLCVGGGLLCRTFHWEFLLHLVSWMQDLL